MLWCLFPLQWLLWGSRLKPQLKRKSKVRARLYGLITNDYCDHTREHNEWKKRDSLTQFLTFLCKSSLLAADSDPSCGSEMFLDTEKPWKSWWEKLMCRCMLVDWIRVVLHPQTWEQDKKLNCPFKKYVIFHSCMSDFCDSKEKLHLFLLFWWHSMVSSRRSTERTCLFQFLKTLHP